MAKVTFVLGLCGAGKTFLANQLKSETGAEIFEGIVGAHNPTGLRDMLDRLRQGMDCVVEEIAYCCAHSRETIVKILRSQVPGVEIEWICLENDLESANWNVTHRDEVEKQNIQGHIDINRKYHCLYTYPDGATIKPIIRINQGGANA